MLDYISDIEGYEYWKDLGIPPRIAIYGRTSKVNGNETNLTKQGLILDKLIYELLMRNISNGGSTYYEIDEPEDFIYNTDLNASGNRINENLQKFLDSLSFEDTILVMNISRLTRMDVNSESFKYLHEKLYQDNRDLYQWNKATQKPIWVSREDFVQYAKVSNEQYEAIKIYSRKGNEKKSEIRRERIISCLEYLEIGLNRNIISKEMGVSLASIDKYIRFLKDNGLIEDKRLIASLSKSTSPVDNIP